MKNKAAPMQQKRGTLLRDMYGPLSYSDDIVGLVCQVATSNVGHVCYQVGWGGPGWQLAVLARFEIKLAGVVRINDNIP